MNTEKNKELLFIERLEEIVDSFGENSQEGVKLALRETQDSFRCVSKSHQSQIADAFNMDIKVVEAIIKFMPSIKESIVKYELVVCTGPRCAKNGSVKVINTLKKELGINFNEVTADGKIRLSSQNCFKKCKDGPNILLNNKFYHHMDEEKTKKLIQNLKDN